MKSGKGKWTMGYKIIAILAAAVILAGTVASAIPAYGADKSALEASVAEAEQMDVSGYTDESVALLQSALNSAAQVILDESATSIRVKNHVTMLNAVTGALIQKTKADAPVSGNYTIKGILRQAYSDNASMGNASITQPMELIVEEGAVRLRLHFSFLTVPGLGEGYLYSISYLPDWDGMISEMTEAQYQAFLPCTTEEYHEGVYDSFNDPNTGTDAVVKGALYPKTVSMPVAWQDPEIWTRIYVPIMESISAGGGTQYARLQPDWSTLTWTAPDKGSLDAAVAQLVQLQGNVLAADYSQEMVDLLEEAVLAGNYVRESINIGQAKVDAMTQALGAVANLFADADKQYLYDMIQLAGNFTTSDYTDTYVAGLMEKIRAAQEVYQNAFATQTQVNEQYALLLQAISNAQKKDTSSTAPVPTPGPVPTPAPEQSETGSSTESGESELDKNNLPDGVYAVTGRMKKSDKSTASMSDDAINHTVKLTVKKGKYKLTMDFMGLQISGSYGYLSQLKYYKTGYTIDGYGAPQGTVKAVTIDSYQLTESGEKVSDIYGTDYPNQVTFPLIPEAVNDGYVPLQIYVPIMEAISAGTGTQSVFLCLDWSTLKATTDDDDDFTDQQSTGSGSTASSGSDFTVNPSLIQGSSLPKSNASASLQGSGTLQTIRADAGLAESTKAAEAAPQTEPAFDLAEAMPSKEEDEKGQAADTGTASSPDPDSSPGPAAIPTVMSVLMAGAGLLFKLKSRGGW